MTEPFIRSPYNYDTKLASMQAATINTEPSLTVQSHAEDADINVIVARFGLTGQMPQNPRVPTYGDFSEIKDYRSAFEAVAAAEAAFMEYPASVRAHFKNDPQLMLDYAEQGGDVLAIAADLTLPKLPQDSGQQQAGKTDA